MSKQYLMIRGLQEQIDAMDPNDPEYAVQLARLEDMRRAFSMELGEMTNSQKIDLFKALFQNKGIWMLPEE